MRIRWRCSWGYEGGKHFQSIEGNGTRTHGHTGTRARLPKQTKHGDGCRWCWPHSHLSRPNECQFPTGRAGQVAQRHAALPGLVYEEGMWKRDKLTNCTVMLPHSMAINLHAYATVCRRCAMACPPSPTVAVCLPVRYTRAYGPRQILFSQYFFSFSFRDAHSSSSFERGPFCQKGYPVPRPCSWMGSGMG